MKKKLFLIASFIVSLLISQNVYSTQYVVNTAGNTFVPATLSINIGDTVIWNNTGGFHNINATLATYPNNPEGFGNVVAAAGWSFQWIFTIPGTYDYQCDPHAGLGMNGVITVNNTQPAALTYIPDDNFETALIALGLDTFPLNDSINTAAIDTVKSLYITSDSIYDLTGIEDFLSLKVLIANDNLISKIDLNLNTELEILYLDNNSIKNLDLSTNTKLQKISLNDNLISGIDLSLNTELEILYLNNNSIKDLDLSTNTKLQKIELNNNSIQNLDLSLITNLVDFSSINNEMLCIKISTSQIISSKNWFTDAAVIFDTIC